MVVVRNTSKSQEPKLIVSTFYALIRKHMCHLNVNKVETVKAGFSGRAAIRRYLGVGERKSRDEEGNCGASIFEFAASAEAEQLRSLSPPSASPATPTRCCQRTHTHRQDEDNMEGYRARADLAGVPGHRAVTHPAPPADPDSLGLPDHSYQGLLHAQGQIHRRDVR